MIQFEILLKDLGEFGSSQIILFVMLSYYHILGGINSLATVFIAYEPNYRCNVPPLDDKTLYPNLSENEILNLTTPYDAASETYDGCYRYGFNLTTCDGSVTCSNTTIPAVTCDMGYYYDRSLFTETVVTEFDLVCDKDYLNALTTSLFYAGFMIGSIIFGNFSDWVGRKICCIVTISGVMGCMFGVTYSRSIEAYIVCRVFLAIFSYGATLGSYVYIMEMVGNKWRTFVGVGYQVFYTIGYMILGGISFQWRNWHDIMLACTIFVIPSLIFVLIIPESPRWLFTNNKEKEGVKVIEKMARINKVEISKETWQEARMIGEKEKSALAKEIKYTTLDLFRTKPTAIITLKVAFNWFVNSFVYYGISLNAGALAGDLFVNNTLNGVFEIASYVFCILVTNKIGRRLLLVFLLLLAGGGLLASAVVNIYAGDNQALITLGVVFAFVAKFGISGSFAIIYNLTSELYPTVIRSNGVAVGSIAARIGGIIAPFLIELQDSISWLPNVLFGVFSIIAGVLSLTFPETNGHEMMETIEEAERFYKGEHRTCENEDTRDSNIKAIAKFASEEQEHSYENTSMEVEQTAL